ncbi:hypothetical protein C0W92_15190 [Photobacterium angustum]|uniref:Uncharacterized protein n=1 Tax=Photobacterium angustum TaxID=661 RepID=A0A855SL65_PHOAN|nr:hypothetical protein [Photobacterium angustum]KJF80914.1 hypothetical protein UB36_14765 [Photobacterium damselae subsp. damselae]KJF98832.1 hypothetical protein UB35_21060 [Photobacterium angustum]KJG27482.1 hypothetical protein UA69_19335 [Photobacterium angustum]KJG38772.1 hypothetical protein UA35_14725 [Photobacterium angustum]KJG44381.1 hypothetical protein UA31_14770 [Photobacterium angustum]
MTTKVCQYFSYDNHNQVQAMVSNITAENVEDVQRSTNDTFKIGMWFLSKVIEGHQFEIYGPFESVDVTMKFAHEHHGITSYRGAPEFDDGMDELLEALKTH